MKPRQRSRKICPAKRSRGFSPHLTSPRWGEGMRSRGFSPHLSSPRWGEGMVRGLSRQGGIKFKIEKVNIISYAIDQNL